jgi:hypothetical protein
MKILAIPFMFILIATQGSEIPDVNLSVSFHEQVEGQAQRKPIYFLDVVCRSGECSYTYVSLNDCGGAGSGSSTFYPKVQSASTRDGDLKVSNNGAVLTLQQTGEDSVGSWTNTFDIGYEPTRDGSPATSIVSFKGNFVKTSELVKRPTRIDYVPLPRAFQQIDLDCPVLAPGVAPR